MPERCTNPTCEQHWAAHWYNPGTMFCSRCERNHSWCECDEFAHLGMHSRHPLNNLRSRPHPMGE